MATSKTSKPTKAPAKPSARLSPVISLKGSDEWADWVEQFSEHLRTTKAGLFDRAVTELAERVGFARPPKR